jgi:hypothetical protein
MFQTYFFLFFSSLEEDVEDRRHQLESCSLAIAKTSIDMDCPKDSLYNVRNGFGWIY